MRRGGKPPWEELLLRARLNGEVAVVLDVQALLCEHEVERVDQLLLGDDVGGIALADGTAQCAERVSA